MNSNNKHILLTGGTGLIGTMLTQQLLDKGYQVSHLTRSPGKDPRVKTYLWDADKHQIDERCIDDIDVIIHLAGAGVAEKRWTKKRKKTLIDSRTKTIELIYEVIKSRPNKVSTVISASATGFYGNRADELLIETTNPADDFLAICCIEWEKAVDKGAALGLKILKFRTGVVLTKKGGALPQIALPVKLWVGSPLGPGKQWVPWIHVQDVLDIYLYGIEKTKLEGVYNMVSPNPVTNEQITQAIARQLHKPLWAPKVPKFILKLLLGEMSLAVLESARVSSSKIEEAGYKFKYPELTGALAEIYG